MYFFFFFYILFKNDIKQPQVSNLNYVNTNIYSQESNEKYMSIGEDDTNNKNITNNNNFNFNPNNDINNEDIIQNDDDVPIEE